MDSQIAKELIEKAAALEIGDCIKAKFSSHSQAMSKRAMLYAARRKFNKLPGNEATEIGISIRRFEDGTAEIQLKRNFDSEPWQNSLYLKKGGKTEKLQLATEGETTPEVGSIQVRAYTEALKQLTKGEPNGRK